jgi:hypothetical protein
MSCPRFCKGILHYLAWVAILGNLFLIGLVAFWQLYPYRLPYVQQPIEILNENNEIKVGETIKMKINLVKERNVEVIVRPNVTCSDGVITPLISKSDTLPVGAHIRLSNDYQMPPAPVGAECKFNFEVVYQVNPIRAEPITWSSEEFKVVKE